MRSFPFWIKVVVTLLAIGTFGYDMLHLGKIYVAYRKDFSTVPPDQVFKMVFATPLPSGVTILRNSGRQYVTQEWIWMRLEAKPESIDPFLRQTVSSKPEKLSSQEAYQLIRQENAADKDYITTDHKRVAWGDIHQIAQPEVYTFAIGPPLYGKSGLLWMGYIIVDRQKNQIFIHAWGD